MPLTDELQKQVRLFVLKWNSDNPVDGHWRRAFKVPFGSPQHLEVDFIDQQLWYEEAVMVRQLRENPEATIDEEGRVIIPKEIIKFCIR